MSDALLLRWQRLLGFSDDQAAQHVGLELREYCRQRATRPSRQTPLIACLIALYRPDLTKIHQALAAFARPPSGDNQHASIDSSSRSEEAVPDLSSDWS